MSNSETVAVTTVMLFNICWACVLYWKYRIDLAEREKDYAKHRQEWLQREKEKLGLPT